MIKIEIVRTVATDQVIGGRVHNFRFGRLPEG